MVVMANEQTPQFNQWYEETTDADRLIRDAAANQAEQHDELSLRPQFLREYIGQTALKEGDLCVSFLCRRGH